MKKNHWFRLIWGRRPEDEDEDEENEEDENEENDENEED